MIQVKIGLQAKCPAEIKLLPHDPGILKSGPQWCGWGLVSAGYILPLSTHGLTSYLSQHMVCCPRSLELRAEASVWMLQGSRVSFMP